MQQEDFQSMWVSVDDTMTFIIKVFVLFVLLCCEVSSSAALN